MLSATRYAIKTESLRPFVKHIWHLEADGEVHHKLLPTGDIDVLINLADDIIYEFDGKRSVAPLCHINGLRSKPAFIHQTGRICVLGISFQAYGLYPFVCKPAAASDQIIDLDTVSPLLSDKLRAAASGGTIDTRISNLESALHSELRTDSGYLTSAVLIGEFLSRDSPVHVSAFCDEKAINLKTFERSVVKYTGYTPNLLHRIKRFQTVSNQLVHQQCGLTDLAYDHHYADQPHLTKEFRRFAGKPPKDFRKQNISVKENIRYGYR